jgi:UDP-2,3-diacylglucosamine pyrophosphatase LpxH
MTANLQFDQLYVISDLHFGGEPGFQIFGSKDEMLWLIEHLISLPVSETIGLVINGDFIDFLAEQPPRHFDPQGALAKLRRITNEDTTFAPIFDRLKQFLSTANRTLLLNLGNHDLELALPWVRQKLASILTNDDPANLARLHIVFDGSGVLASVGNRSVLCVHGNEVDAFNPADFEKIRQIGRDIQFGKTVEDWIPNAGSKMVIEIMNPLKATYPFVDLLKPEGAAVIPTLLACDPKLSIKLDNVFGLLGFGSKWLQTIRPFTLPPSPGMLGGEQIPAPVSGQDTRGLTNAYMAWKFKNRQPDNRNSLGEDMMLKVEQQIKDNILPADLLQDDAEQQLGAFRATFDFIMGESNAEVLREILEKLDTDPSFDLEDHDETFLALDEKISGNIDFLVAGHTHLERALPRTNGGGVYFNSGTWARLIRIKDTVRQNKTEFWRLFNLLKNSNMATLDAQEDLIMKPCTVVAIKRSENGVVGELCNVIATQSDTTTMPTSRFELKANPATRFPKA